jgi:ATP-dependent Clp protease ATP-binding subunit ClpA
MAQTGEKYTDARRALLASGGESGGAGEDPGVAILWPDDSLGWFTDQAYNLILLAEDEARMLSHSSVEPEHLLLATTRRGNVQRLLAGLDHAIHDLILRIDGFGEKLELRPQRSPASEAVLRRAVTAAADRGVLGPSTEHLLLAVGEQELPARILGELGITDVQALVDAKYPVTRPPIDPAIVQVRAAQLAVRGQTPSSPGPIPPVFERFTAQARDAINAGVEHARKLDAPYVEPAHLLYGVLDAKTGVVATVRSRYTWDLPPAQFVEPRYPRATDIFSDDARRIVSEDVLIIAERLGHRPLTTGHLLIAILESPDEHTGEITSLLPDGREITAAVIGALPGQEEP